LKRELNRVDKKILLTDSRSLSDAKRTLFFALRTHRGDGHRYIAELYDKGVRHFVIEESFDATETMPDAQWYPVKDTWTALQNLAANHRKQFDVPVIGITGSNGKTIVKEWLYQLLHNHLNIVRSPRSYNSQTGVPLSVWQLSEQTQLGIFEAGISLSGEMARLEPIIRPTIGIFTTIGEAHQENFYSQEEKCLEKLTLFEHSQVVIYNEDQVLVHYCMLKKGLSDKCFAWSKINREAPLFIEKIEKEIDHTHIFYRGEHITIPFTDDASIEDAIHCLATILYLSEQNIVAIDNLEAGFAGLEPVAMRLDVCKGANGNILINDTYNSDINSLAIALDFMSRRSLDNTLKPVVILSDILQSGMESRLFYQKVADLVTQKQVTQFVGIGPDLMENAALFKLDKVFFKTTEAFLNAGYLNQWTDSIILIKGSRKFQFERISEQLEEKVHQTTLEVDLDAVTHNFKYFRSKLKPETKVICMVKAFGYGIGSYELAKTLQDQGCDYLAVAVADEGYELRREGITMPIMVMNPEIHAFNMLFDCNLEPEVYSFGLLNSLIKEAGRRGIMNYPVHIKLNTGMNRLGFDPEEIGEVAAILKQQQAIKVRSVFSHLAGSDSPELDTFTMLQLQKFMAVSGELESLLQYPVMRHVLNSAGIERFPDYQHQMVRLGIGLYGISAVDQNLLKPVATLKTRILQIRHVKKGETIGYNRKDMLKSDSVIACLPVGYADGLDRRLGNRRSSVLINGLRCPIVGNICMDISLVDITGVSVKEGDEAIIFGQDISISELAKQLDTIPYEILTSVSPRVKRVYFKE